MHPGLIRLLPIALFAAPRRLHVARHSAGCRQRRTASSARAVLQKSAEAHGLAAFRQIDDLSVAYAGEWYGLVSKVQPTLIDADFRQGSQERIVFQGRAH